MNQSYANQKRYSIQKKIEEGDVFIMLSWKDYTAAANDLSPAAMKLFMYLAKNQDGYTFWFSSKDYCKTFNLVDSTFRKAKKELIEKGYLKETENNCVYFNVIPVFLETKESLQNRTKEIGSILAAKNADLEMDFRLYISNKRLPEIQNDEKYKIEIKDVIAYGERLLSQIGADAINKLL